MAIGRTGSILHKIGGLVADLSLLQSTNWGAVGHQMASIGRPVRRRPYRAARPPCFGFSAIGRTRIVRFGSFQFRHWHRHIWKRGFTRCKGSKSSFRPPLCRRSRVLQPTEKTCGPGIACAGHRSVTSGKASEMDVVVASEPPDQCLFIVEPLELAQHDGCLPVIPGDCPFFAPRALLLFAHNLQQSKFECVFVFAHSLELRHPLCKAGRSNHLRRRFLFGPDAPPYGRIDTRVSRRRPGSGITRRFGSWLLETPRAPYLFNGSFLQMSSRCARRRRALHT